MPRTSPRAAGAHTRSGIWFISEARTLAIVAAGLVFTIAVVRPQALRPPARDFQSDDEDFEEDDFEEER